MDQNNPNNDEINVIELFGVLRENFFNLIVVILFFAICSVIYSFFQPEIWRSSTILEVSSKISGGGSSSGGGLQLAGIKLKDDKSDLPEDDLKKTINDIQKITDEKISQIEKILEQKKIDILKV